MGRIKKAVREMRSLEAEYLAKRTADARNVHQSLLLRAGILLKNSRPETEEFFSPMFRTMMRYTRRPDKKGDYENGMGRHYYCAASFTGRQLSDVSGYLRNGVKRLSKSARTMLEEDFTMALAMERAGFTDRAAELLGRAVHMAADMCCLPHATGMTYYSAARPLHKAYEDLAEAVYPEFIAEQSVDTIPDIFPDRSSFGRDLENLVRGTAGFLDEVFADPMKCLTEQLLRTERVIAALLLRFYDDCHSPEREVHCITAGSGCRFKAGTAPLTVKITADGIVFHGVNPSPESGVNVTRMSFYAAHRRDGLFTLSPARSRKDLVLEISGGKIKLVRFDPIHGEQLFRLI